MRRWAILTINILVILAVSLLVLQYSQRMTQNAIQLKTDSFLVAVSEKTRMAERYWAYDKQICLQWKKVIEGDFVSLEESAQLIASVEQASEIEYHLIWADTLQGFSSKGKVTNSDNHSVDYKALSDLFSNLTSDVDCTRGYTNPNTGTRVVAQCVRVNLFDSETSSLREAYMLRVLPESYFNDNWFLSTTENERFSIVNTDGMYVVKNTEFKNSNFFEYIFSYNEAGTAEAVMELFGQDSGIFRANDYNGRDCLFAFSHFEDNAHWILLSTIPTEDLVTEKTDNTITIIIAAALTVILAVDVFYLYTLYRNENAIKRSLSEKETQLTDALANAEHANRAKTVFLNNMSHDIRTPMNAIIGFTTLAAKHIDNRDQVQEYLAKINTSSSHLLSLINDILDMSRIESGKVKIDEREVHLPEVFHDMRSILQSDARSRGIELFFDTLDVHDEDVYCDRLRLNQILLNLIGNALKFTKTGGQVSIRVIQKPCSVSGLANYEFCVKDTGIGMSPDFLSHVFESFSREETSTVSGIQGSGLGLAITKNIVDMMGGTISVESELGKGSEFIVDLTFRLLDKSIEYKEIKELKGMRALIADDDAETCCSVGKMLSEIGLRPDWTTSGKEAVLRAKFAKDSNDSYGVYLIDWLMPDLNGIETVRRIRKVIGDSVPIIILTAYDWTEIEEEARAAGVSYFCAKPLFLSELREILSRPFCEQKAQENSENSDLGLFGKKVLLVEDNELNQEIAYEILSDAGINVTIVSDGSQAVETMKTCSTHAFDMILMDIQMPIMDGYTATRLIRNLEDPEKNSIPIFAMTANAFEEDRRKAFDAGMSGHLAKPINVSDLLHTISEVLG